MLAVVSFIFSTYNTINALHNIFPKFIKMPKFMELAKTDVIRYKSTDFYDVEAVEKLIVKIRALDNHS